jgi:gas vesicle protein
MNSPIPAARAQLGLYIALAAAVVLLLNAQLPANAQVMEGVQKGAKEGNKAAGPVGGVLGGAIGGVVGVFTGVLGAGQTPANNAKQPPGSAKSAKDAAKETAKEAAKETAKDAGKAAKAAKVAKEAAVLTQEQGEPQLTAEQIVANSDANIDRIKAELNLTPEQEKKWGPFNSAMHYLGHNGADRLNLRIERAKRDPPDSIIEQMRNEAQFLDDRAVDQRNVADAAEPLFTTLDDKQKQTFIEEMVRLSHERGLD